MRDPVNAAQQYSEEGDEVGNTRQHLVGIERQGTLGQIIAIAELLEVERGEQQYGGPANFRFAVDVRQIGSGIVLDALAGFLQKLVAVAKLGGAGGTDFRAGRRFAFGHTRRAHDAFAHAGNRLVPFVFGNAEGTGRHAITASHAFVFVVGDGTKCGFLESSYRTNGSAGRIVAVHAEFAHELVVLGEDGGVL